MEVAINATIVTGIPTNRTLQKLIRVSMKQARPRKKHRGRAAPRQTANCSMLKNRETVQKPACAYSQGDYGSENLSLVIFYEGFTRNSRSPQSPIGKVQFPQG
jgi:hypothetical protein